MGISRHVAMAGGAAHILRPPRPCSAGATRLERGGFELAAEGWAMFPNKPCVELGAEATPGYMLASYSLQPAHADLMPSAFGLAPKAPSAL